MPSFIQTSRQSAGVTWSPYHWWTISWTSTLLGGVVGVAQRDHRLGLHAAHRVDEQDAERRRGRGRACPRPSRAPPGGAQLVEVLAAPRGDPVGDRHAAGGLVLGDLVVADREGDEVRRRWLVEVPVGGGRAVRPRRGSTSSPLATPTTARARGGEVVERLVGRLVVDGVPGVGAERLLHRPRLAVVGDREAGGGEVAAGGRRRRPAGGCRSRRSDSAYCWSAAKSPSTTRSLPRARTRASLAVELDAPTARARRRSSWTWSASPVARKVSVLDAGQRAGVGVPGRGRGRSAGRRPRVADVGVDAVLDGLADRGVERVASAAVGVGRGAGRRGRPSSGAARRGVVVAAGGQAGEQRGGGQRGGQSASASLGPRSSGRASLRPWWICAFTVPSGAPTCSAISS